jgi:hypothetical protein
MAAVDAYSKVCQAAYMATGKDVRKRLKQRAEAEAARRGGMLEEPTPETVRIAPEAYRALARYAAATHTTLLDSLTLAARILEREAFFAGLNADFAALRSDKKAWREEQEERTAWDATNADGLVDE